MKFYANDVATLSQRRLRPAFIDDPQMGSFLEALPDGAALLEIDGTIKLVNNKLELVLNLAKGELVGTELGKHVKTSGPIVQKLVAALQQLKRTEVAGVLNSQRSVIASINILRTPDGGAYGALMTMRESARQVRSSASEGFRFESEMVSTEGGRYVQTATLDALAKRASTALERGSPVILTGESGTGKTEFARRMATSGQAEAIPFVQVNCGMLSEEHFDTEMFGIEPGSSLDTSTRGKLGYVEVADGGILFLDQISDLSRSAQMKLVALLETQTFSRVGSAQRRRIRIRLITSTNEDLQDLTARGSFRKDLYYRISVVNVALPNLSEHMDLVDAIVDRHLQRINLGRKPPLMLSSGFRDCLRRHTYPGNVRELINILDYAAAAADDVALPEHFCVPPIAATPDTTTASPTTSRDMGARSFRELVQEFETWVLEKSIAENGSKRSAAKALGIDVATLIRKTKRNQ
jgi:transcriptional regulator with PAS, ATPase and Fis domain